MPGVPRLVRVIAASQVWGGAVGSWGTAQALFSLSDNAAVAGAVLTLVLFYYAFSGATAVFVLRGRQRAIPYLVLAQLPQLIVLQTAHFQYRLLSGFYVLAKIGAFTGFEVGIMSGFSLHWSGPFDAVLGVNLAAVAVVWYLRSPASRRGVESRQFPLRALDQLGAAEVTTARGEPPGRESLDRNGEA